MEERGWTEIQLRINSFIITTNFMLKINTHNTVNRAYIWLKLVSDSDSASRILYRDLSDSPFFGDNLMGLVSSG